MFLFFLNCTRTHEALELLIWQASEEGRMRYLVYVMFNYRKVHFHSHNCIIISFDHILINVIAYLH